MSLQFQVLGAPGRDNALWVTVDSGQHQHDLLFDCGEGCPEQIPWGRLLAVEALFFSHFHIDHVAGFDGFFRAVWDRAHMPVTIFGPAGTRAIMHHRAQGFTWNLASEPGGELCVTDIDADQLTTSHMFSREGFATAHDGVCLPFAGVAYRGSGFVVEALLLDHGTPSVGYIVREDTRPHVDAERMERRGLRPGPWVKLLKDPAVADAEVLEVDGQTLAIGELRAQLCHDEVGESIAYLTDFRLADERAMAQLVERLRGCQTLVCENNFRDAERELAMRSFHLVSSEVGELAARVAPRELVLFHISDRYTAPDWRAQLADVQRIFPRTRFPAHWDFA